MDEPHLLQVTNHYGLRYWNVYEGDGWTRFEVFEEAMAYLTKHYAGRHYTSDKTWV